MVNILENVTDDAIHITQAGSGFWRFLTFTGNQFGLYSNNVGYAISLVAEDAGALSEITVTGNVFHTDGTPRAAVKLVNVDNIAFANNVLSGFDDLYDETTSTNISEGGGATELDDLSDVTITAPEEDQQLQHIGGVWVNNHRRWEPVTTNPGGGPEIVFDRRRHRDDLGRLQLGATDGRP